jgi:hypothetical protein
VHGVEELLVLERRRGVVGEVGGDRLELSAGLAMEVPELRLDASEHWGHGRRTATYAPCSTHSDLGGEERVMSTLTTPGAARVERPELSGPSPGVTAGDRAALEVEHARDRDE